MIGYLRGKIIAQDPPHLVIDVNGVGYEVEASSHTFSSLLSTKEDVMLHTHFIVREDAQLLFGFHDLAERNLFRSLIKVSGIGGKLALSVLSAVKPSVFIQYVLEKNVARLKDIPGIGKKTAERLIIEMRDKLADWQMQRSDESSELDQLTQDAVHALIALGYKSHEAMQAIRNIDTPTQDKNSEILIRLALKELNKKRGNA